MQAFAEFSFDTFFITVGGIDIDMGVTEYNPEDAAVKRAAFANARRHIVVTDASKVGRTPSSNPSTASSGQSA